MKWHVLFTLLVLVLVMIYSAARYSVAYQWYLTGEDTFWFLMQEYTQIVINALGFLCIYWLALSGLMILKGEISDRD